MVVLRTLSAALGAVWLLSGVNAGAAPLTGGALQIHDPTILPASAPVLRDETGNLRIEASIITAIGWSPLTSPDATFQLEGALVGTANPVPADPVVPALPAAGLAGLATALLATGFWLGRWAPPLNRLPPAPRRAAS
jgi:hypothetical protein